MLGMHLGRNHPDRIPLGVAAVIDLGPLRGKHVGGARVGDGITSLDTALSLPQVVNV
jgi:hypothetical protein